MHIVFLTSEYPKPGYPHGGVGTVVKTIARALVRKGIKISVVGVNYTNEFTKDEDEGVVIFRLKRSKVPKMGWLIHNSRINRQLAELHKKKPIDIIESAEMGLAFIRKLKGVQYLIRMHGGHHFFAESENRGIEPWKAFQEKRSFKKADHVIGVSQYVMDHTSKYIDLQGKRGKPIYNPANLEMFYPADHAKEIKGRVFFAGSICEKKGVRQLVKAMPAIKKAVPEAHLLIAGRDTKIRGTKDSYVEYLKTEIPDEVKEDIHFLGSLENTQIPKEIEKAEVCAYPSHMEAMPLAWIEVLSMGKPFVASKLGPGREAVKHGVTGLLCNPLDIDELARQVSYMLQNRDKAHQMGKNAIQDVHQRFGLDKLIDDNLAMYQKLINK